MARTFSAFYGATIGLFYASISFANTYSRADLASVTFAYRHPFAGETLENSLSDFASQKVLLEEATAFLKREPTIHVYVKGYADTAECAHQNCQVLSDRRAQLVYDWLLTHGVNEAQLEGRMGFGNMEPIDFEDTEAQRTRNRRVQFALTFGNDP